MNDDLHEHVRNLQMQIAHLQRHYDQLNEVVTSQAMEIDRMHRHLAALQTQVSDLKEKPQPPGDPLDEKPPHY